VDSVTEFFVAWFEMMAHAGTRLFATYKREWVRTIHAPDSPEGHEQMDRFDRMNKAYIRLARARL
jgi:hypothetical protein